MLRRPIDDHERATLALARLHLAEVHLRAGSSRAARRLLREVGNTSPRVLRGEPVQTRRLLSFIASGGKTDGEAVARDLADLAGRQEAVRADFVTTLKTFGLWEQISAEDFRGR